MPFNITEKQQVFFLEHLTIWWHMEKAGVVRNFSFHQNIEYIMRFYFAISEVARPFQISSHKIQIWASCHETGGEWRMTTITPAQV